jgi:hypothetical protein
MAPAALAALSRREFTDLAAGMAVARAGYDGLRRNALLALGAARDRSARALIERLCDDGSAMVREAARWAEQRMDGALRQAPERIPETPEETPHETRPTIGRE